MIDKDDKDDKDAISFAESVTNATSGVVSPKAASSIATADAAISRAVRPPVIGATRDVGRAVLNMTFWATIEATKEAIYSAT